MSDITAEDIAKFQSGQTAELYKRQAVRKTLPLGQYIRFIIAPNTTELKKTEVKETDEGTKGGDLYVKFQCVPLKDPESGESALVNMATNHMMFPPRAAAEGEEEFNNLYLWEDFFEAVRYEREDGAPMPARGEYDRKTKVYSVDGVEVDRDTWVARNEGERAEWIRVAVLDLIGRVHGGGDPLGNKAFFAKCAEKDGFINITTSKRKGGGKIVATLPAGEVYASFI